MSSPSSNPTFVVPSSQGHTVNLREWIRCLDEAFQELVCQSPTPTSSLLQFLETRYGFGGRELVIERLNSLRTLLKTAQEKWYFEAEAPTVLVASSGRDRVFLGHSDLLGLGGPTVDCATAEELLGVIQLSTGAQTSHSSPPCSVSSSDLIIKLSNHHSDLFASHDISVQEVFEIITQLASEEGGRGTATVRKVWDERQWYNYIRAVIGHILSPHFPASQRIKKVLLPCNQGKESEPLKGRVIRFHAGSFGELQLPWSGGVSSSSALTGAFVLGLDSLLGLRLSISEIVQTDFGEFLLGKRAGAADKTAQMMARLGQVVMIGSLPQKFISSADFASLNQLITAFIAISPTPRLTTSVGREWLKSLSPSSSSSSSSSSFTTTSPSLGFDWATSIMSRFSSTAFLTAIHSLLETLQRDQTGDAYGITSQEGEAVIKALNGGEEDEERKSFGPLLRELCDGGAIERTLPELSGWKNRHRRYNLIYRLLKLIPETIQLPSPSPPSSSSLWPSSSVISARKAALYGLSEVERGHHYWRLLLRLRKHHIENRNPEKAEKVVSKLLDLVRFAHDGDRATLDYRHNFQPTSWASNPRNDVSDATLNFYINNKTELVTVPGGFERSIPELDEIATLVDEKFGKKAAMRISAAGLGGVVCFHAHQDVLEELQNWLRNDLGWTIRPLRQGAGSTVIHPTISTSQLKPSQVL